MTQEELFKKLVAHSKEYGFIFPSSEIYDGLSAVYDYGQLGVELKNNIKRYWWDAMTKLNDNIVVIDSVAALVPKAEIEGDMGSSHMGLQARLMSQALRKLTSSISKTKTVCIFINQLRDKIGVVYGNPETTTGGNALKFYASVRIDIRRMSVIKDGEDQLGTRTKVKVVKNKVAPPFKRAEFDIMFGEGISKIGEIVDLGVDYGVVKKAGSWFSYGDRKIGQGRDAVKELLKNDEELRNEIEAKVREAMKTTKKE